MKKLFLSILNLMLPVAVIIVYFAIIIALGLALGQLVYESII